MTGNAHRGIAYRPEIDGLRAIAVLAVIFYHAGFEWMSGGFLGVDLFFVISGYLITGILLKDLEIGDFSIRRFYVRRIRRILPALLLVMLLCIPLAFWLMLPDDLENFGQSLVGTALFANNILLLVTTGYFNADNHFKPLMHSWSLGVEEQYYLVVPLLMWAAWRLGKASGVTVGIAAVTLASFAASLFLSHRAPQQDFFLIVSRGWEIGAGALAVLTEPHLRGRFGTRLEASLAALGLALLAAAIAIAPDGSAPGLRTVLPVAGLCLILQFGGARDPAGRLLAAPPLVAIGLVSYSAYLFHQPVFAFARLLSLEEPAAWTMSALLLPIFACAWLSWRFVEQPFRDPARTSTRTVLLGCGAATLLATAAGLTFHFSAGFPNRWPELADSQGAGGAGANIAYNMAPERFRGVPLPDRSGHPRVLVVGNSFARDFINMGLETGALKAPAISFAEIADCQRLPRRALDNLERADAVVLATRFEPKDVHCIVQRVGRLRGMTSVPIIVIGRKSFGYNNNAVMRLPQQQRRAWRATPIADAVAANDAAKRALPPAIYVDMLGMLGDAQGRVPVFTPDMKLISQDREHLTRPGARYVGSIIFHHPALAALAATRQAQHDPSAHR